VDHAKLNAAYTENEMLLYDPVNVGLAVETPKGLMVVVIKDANKLTLENLSAVRDDLVSKVQDGIQVPEDLQGGTFTITNLGMFGIKSFDPIIIPGQSGILGVGSLQIDETGNEKINVTLACDHRLVSGVDGARFLQTFIEYFSDTKEMFSV
jgi:pyruvate dehydrogenase E2 component (dihydrolipoamide acetyltransferase)